MYRKRRIIGIVVLWLDKCYWSAAMCPLPLVEIPYKKHCSQRSLPVALPFLSRGAHHQGKAYLHRIESLHNPLVLHYEVRQSKLAVSSAHVVATLAFKFGVPWFYLQGCQFKNRGCHSCGAASLCCIASMGKEFIS